MSQMEGMPLRETLMVSVLTWLLILSRVGLRLQGLEHLSGELYVGAEVVV